MRRETHKTTLWLFLFCAQFLSAEALRPLPTTLDNVQLGIGDMFPQACRRHVPFRIWVIQNSSLMTAAPGRAAPEALNRRSLKRFTAELNKRFHYLSGGRFSLRLKQVRIIKMKAGDSPGDVEKQAVEQSGGRGVVMIVGPYDGGTYLGGGVFKIAPEEVTARPFNRKALHEILHGLISPAHSTSRSSTLEQYNPLIGLDPQEARFLGWPERPALPPDASVFE